MILHRPGDLVVRQENPPLRKNSQEIGNVFTPSADFCPGRVREAEGFWLISTQCLVFLKEDPRLSARVLRVLSYSLGGGGGGEEEVLCFHSHTFRGLEVIVFLLPISIKLVQLLAIGQHLLHSFLIKIVSATSPSSPVFDRKEAGPVY